MEAVSCELVSAWYQGNLQRIPFFSRPAPLSLLANLLLVYVDVLRSLSANVRSL